MSEPRLPRRFRVGRRYFYGLVLWLLPAIAAAGDVEVRETQLKAAFLVNFAKFVDWPAAALPQSRTDLVVGVLGSGALERELEAVEGREIRGRRLAVRRIGTDDEAPGCHVIFVGDSARLPELLASLGGAPVLLVGEGESFLDDGGTIRLFRDDARIRFAVNLESADRAQLRLSSQLLKLATQVRAGTDGG